MWIKSNISKFYNQGKLLGKGNFASVLIGYKKDVNWNI